MLSEQRTTFANGSYPAGDDSCTAAVHYGGVLGIVLTASRECIEGTTVEVVGGPVLVGQKAMQKTQCDLERFTGGFMFDDPVALGIEMTVRASAPGYVSQVRTVEIDWSELITLTLVPVASNDHVGHRRGDKALVTNGNRAPVTMASAAATMSATESSALRDTHEVLVDHRS